jgi:lysophospholipase L1-like esterase
MKATTTFLVLLACAFASTAFPAAATPTPKERAKAKRDAMLAQVTDVPGLPRVLLLGDSISMGYTARVRELLAGKANVHRPAENCFDSANGLKKLDAWLGSGKWEVVHFNFGLHDNKYVDEKGTLVPVEQGKVVSTPEQYERNLREFVTRLKKTGATLICATTTPVPAKSTGRREGSEVAYNAAVKRIAEDTGITVNDLHAFVARHADAQQLPNNVHFTDQGYAQLAQVVAAKIEAALAKRR